MEECYVTKRVEFDAGHRIPNHKSKCRHPHGHRYVLECTFIGPVIDTPGASDQGMVVDFGDLKTIMQKFSDRLDHGFMVYKEDISLLQAFSIMEKQDSFEYNIIALPCIPTAENLANLFFTNISHEISVTRTDVVLDTVRLYETPNSWAEIRRNHAEESK